MTNKNDKVIEDFGEEWIKFDEDDSYEKDIDKLLNQLQELQNP